MKKLLLISVLFFGTFFFAEDAFATANVYYSVGQSSSNLLAGTSVTVTLTSGAAVFNVAQTGNIGVGDRVTYDSDNKVAFIAAKTNADQKYWTLITKTGGIPADVSAVAVGSIKHEYTSLSAAITGAKDSNHINNADLTVADVALNIPCYYDSGPDTTVVSITGYTTGVSNYIKIYTPNNTSTEANNSQRHRGKWDDGKYNHLYTNNTNIDIWEDYVFIDGLQIKHIDTSASAFRAIRRRSSSGIIHISNNIIIGDTSGSGVICGFASDGGTTNDMIYNNVIYSFNGSGLLLASPSYVYNNTILDCAGKGISIGASVSVLAKNNLVYNNTDNYYGTFDASGTNNLTSGTDPQIPATNKRENVAVIFVDAANKDFRLAPTDTGARNFGADLSTDSYLPVTTDIEGQARPTGINAFDIGADEMNYSVSNLRGVGSTRGYVNYR